MSNLSLSSLGDKDTFEHNLRVAKMLCKSDLVPKQYQDNGDGKGIANAMLALNIANRMQSDPLQIMQNLTIIHGKPSWSSQFIIAAINSSKRFSTLNFKHEGEGMESTCYAYAVDNKTGERLESPVVSMTMAKAEGWLDKNGSKWKTMPKLMLMYRAASFFGRLYCPEILMGFQSTEEIIDVFEPNKTITYNPSQVEAIMNVIKANPSPQSIIDLEVKLTQDNVSIDQMNEILLLANEIVNNAASIQPEANEESNEGEDGSGQVQDGEKTKSGELF